MTLVILILIGGLLTLGLFIARKKRYETHRWIQTSGLYMLTILAGIFVYITWFILIPNPPTY